MEGQQPPLLPLPVLWKGQALGDTGSTLGKASTAGDGWVVEPILSKSMDWELLICKGCLRKQGRQLKHT